VPRIRYKRGQRGIMLPYGRGNDAQRTEGIGGLAMVARGPRWCNLTKPYTIAAAAVAPIINNNGPAAASRTINWLNQVAAGKGVNTCIRTAAIATTIT
jgi:hypothetical protein